MAPPCAHADDHGARRADVLGRAADLSLRRPKPIAPIDGDAGGPALVSPTRGPRPEAAAAAAGDAGALERSRSANRKAIRCTPKGGRKGDWLPSAAITVGARRRSRAIIRDNIACAPPSAAPFTVSFVLTADFERKKLHLWAGHSGTLKKRDAGDLIRCVEHAIAPPDWNLRPPVREVRDQRDGFLPATGPPAQPLGGSYSTRRPAGSSRERLRALSEASGEEATKQSRRGHDIVSGVRSGHGPCDESRGCAARHVVIIGGGFGGLNAARALAGADVRITLLIGATIIV